MFSMKETCEQVNMTYEALKFYCNQQLVPNVKRDKNNRRVFDEQDIAWIKSLGCLKKCGMSIKEMKEYLELCQQGNSTIPARKKILDKKREEILTSINELQESINFIDWKQGFYDNLLACDIEYTSPLKSTNTNESFTE